MSEPCRDTMSIHTRKITDACRDKDCIEDLRVYLTTSSQDLLSTASGVRAKCAELLTAVLEVEPVAFDRHHYCVDVTFYYRILADATVGTTRPVMLTGLATFTKRAVLCGEDSHAHIFTSGTTITVPGRTAKYPTAVVEVLDPMVLASRVLHNSDTTTETGTPQFPTAVTEYFDEPLVTDSQSLELLVTLGQFSIIRLERDAQIVIPFVEYAIPAKACSDAPGCAEDPCEVFSRISFPTQQFTPTGCEEKCCDRQAET